MIDDVMLLSDLRTAVGSFRGALKDIAPAEFGRLCIVEAMACGQRADDVGHVLMGQVIRPDRPTRIWREWLR